VAKQLLNRQSPESIATALIRLYREKLPAPEEVTIQAAPPPEAFARSPRAPREAVPFERRQDSAPMVWFRAGVGRKNNADPKWLIPLICRLGGITKQEIGVIRIFDRETKIEILAGAAARFSAAVAAAPNNDLILEPTTPPGGGAKFHDPGPRPAKIKARPPRPADAKPSEQARRKKNRAERSG
jgi:ATP-dependent RNA helicase DeaD